MELILLLQESQQVCKLNELRIICLVLHFLVLLIFFTAVALRNASLCVVHRIMNLSNSVSITGEGPFSVRRYVTCLIHSTVNALRGGELLLISAGYCLIILRYDG
jgi:hypothetical protein